MIGKLKGVLDSTGEDWAVIDVQGVGYHVQCSSRTLGALPAIGEPVTLAIETYVREDQIRLFGFDGDVERDWFRLLLAVQGVGTKVALAILGTLAPDDLAGAIALRDKAQVARAPGVGPKVAQRIINELKDKVSALAAGDAPVSLVSDRQAGARGTAGDAVSALVNLGYAPAQANGAVVAALRDGGEAADTAELIRRGLKELAR